jgi:hypothetical protein
VAGRLLAVHRAGAGFVMASNYSTVPARPRCSSTARSIIIRHGTRRSVRGGRSEVSVEPRSVLMHGRYDYCVNGFACSSTLRRWRAR